MALDGVTWPQSNPKTLRVTFGTKVLIPTSIYTIYQGFSPFQCQEEMKKLAEGGDDPGVVGRLGVELEGRSLLRDWDRNKVDQEKEEEGRKRKRRRTKDYLENKRESVKRGSKLQSEDDWRKRGEKSLRGSR